VEIKLKLITVNDDLHKLTKDLNAAAWDKANDIKGYAEKYVREFLENADNVLLVAYVNGNVAGVSLASKNYAPTKIMKAGCLLTRWTSARIIAGRELAK